MISAHFWSSSIEYTCPLPLLFITLAKYRVEIPEPHSIIFPICGNDAFSISSQIIIGLVLKLDHGKGVEEPRFPSFKRASFRLSVFCIDV